MTRDWISAAFLVLLGISQMAGDLFGILPLKGLAAATAASPAPKVFSAVEGLETFSTRFYLEWPGRKLEVSPEVYSRVRGPYNRRNVYGAALAYAPVLPPEMRSPVMRYALCGDAPLLRELTGDSTMRPPWVEVFLEPLPSTSIGTLPLRFRVICASGNGPPE